MVYDETNDYDNAFHVGGAMMLCGGLLLLLLHLPQLRRYAVNPDQSHATTGSMSAELPIPGDDERDLSGTRFSSDTDECENEIALTVRDNNHAA